MTDQPAVYAWIGEDELGSGQVGIKQGFNIHGDLVAMFSVNKEKISRPELVKQLQAQANRHGKTIQLVRYVPEETVLELKPRGGVA